MTFFGDIKSCKDRQVGMAFSRGGAGPRFDLWAYSAAGRLRTSRRVNGSKFVGTEMENLVFFSKEPSMMIYNDVYSWSIDDLLDGVFSDFQPKKQSLPGASLILLLPFAFFWYQNKMLEYQVKQTKNRRLRDETQQLGTGDFWGVVCDLSQWFLGFF